MDEPVFLKGRTRRLMLAGDRLYLQHLDGRSVADFHVDAIARVGTVIGDECFRECIWFVSPDVAVEGTTLHHNPYVVDVDIDNGRELSEFTNVLFDAVFERRRIPAPVHTAPVRTLSGARLDLQAHLGKMPTLDVDVDVELLGRAALMADHHLRDDEVVLGAVPSIDGDTLGLLVLTSKRALDVYPHTGAAGDLLFQSLTGISVVDTPERGMRLQFDNGYASSSWAMRDRTHAEFLAEQGMTAIEAIVMGGSVRPRQPSSVEMFDAFELLVERRKLGMVADDEFAWQVQGLFTALTGN